MEEAKVNKKKEEDAIEMENALLEGGAAWDIGVKGIAKKRKTAKGESRAKKSKTEKLVGWGEVTDMEQEWSVRDWLVSKDDDEDDDKEEVQ